MPSFVKDQGRIRARCTYEKEYGCDVHPTGSPEDSRTKSQHFFDLIRKSVGSCCEGNDQVMQRERQNPDTGGDQEQVRKIEKIVMEMARKREREGGKREHRLKKSHQECIHGNKNCSPAQELFLLNTCMNVGTVVVK